jgi:hypothetical protein
MWNAEWTVPVIGRTVDVEVRAELPGGSWAELSCEAGEVNIWLGRVRILIAPRLKPNSEADRTAHIIYMIGKWRNNRVETKEAA